MPFSPTYYWYSSHRIGRLSFLATGLPLLAAGIGIVMWSQKGLSLWLAVPLLVLVAHSALCLLSLRLHDCGRSGWWSWIIILLAGLAMSNPVAAGLCLIILAALAVLRGHQGHNRYGPAPFAR